MEERQEEVQTGCREEQKWWADKLYVLQSDAAFGSVCCHRVSK